MSVERRPIPLTGALLVSVVVAALTAQCLDPRELPQGMENECARCHGSEDRPGTRLSQSAPPRDLAGNADVAYPGVGAHSIHLEPSSSHRAVACEECHPVPSAVDSPGHYDDGPPVDLEFHGVARQGDRTPRYDFSTRRCSDTYCHGAPTERWNRPRPPDEACGSCHGLPPAAPHVQSDECWRCHGEVIDAAGRFVAPELHVDGIVQAIDPGCHACHGTESSPAPPPALDGSTSPASRPVGAHSAHLAARSSRSVACEECHVVPAEIDAPGHLDSTPGAEVVFSGLAVAEGPMPEWRRGAGTCAGTYCHGGGESPSWAEVGPLGCDSCHGAPPAPPHPQMDDCALCHGRVVGSEDSSIAPALHVNGIVEVEVPESCSACHGSPESPAPPPDVAGNVETEAPGVGAHERHLAGSDRARALSCDECHVVPGAVLADGHMDTPRPAEVAFRGPATAFGAAPRYVDGRCVDTFCHGGSFVGNRASGGSLTEPRWAWVDGSQTRCGTCHGLPPPAPHPSDADDCARCHSNVRADRTFIDPSLHVNGLVDF